MRSCRLVSACPTPASWSLSSHCSLRLHLASSVPSAPSPVFESSSQRTISTSSIHSTSSRSASSSLWIQRQSSDPYVKARLSSSSDHASSDTAATEAFVSRSAFKLLELHQACQNRLIRAGMTIVDLGAAPGGWCQAAHAEIARAERNSSSSSRGKAGAGRAMRKGVIVAVDLLPLSSRVTSIDRVHAIQGNFLDPIVQKKVVDMILRETGGKATTKGGKGARVDLVLSDMLANLSGNVLRDAQLSLDLSEAALEFALANLTPSSRSSSSSPSTTSESIATPASMALTREARLADSPRLIIKHLQSSLSSEFQTKLRKSFGSVRWEKPPSCRAESREGYWVCSKFLDRSTISDKARKKSSKDQDEAVDLDALFF